MNIQAADRVRALPPYLFAQIDKMKAEARERGVDLIDFGIGDPDLPTPPHIIEALHRGAAEPSNHRYPSYEGSPRCRAAAAEFYRSRFNVELDSNSQVVTLIGSKEGLAHFPLAMINPDDQVLVPDPAYPVYATTARFAGAKVVRYPLMPERSFLPDLDAIDKKEAMRAKVLYINYPNNPTGGTATLEDFTRIYEYACEYNLIVVSDLAYSEMYLDELRPPSFLQVPGAMERSLEFYSLSKTYNMTGWRVGYAVGNPELVAALGKIKTNVDSGVFGAVQEAAIAALSEDQSCVEQMRGVYRERRDLLIPALQKLGIKVDPPKATFYLFCPVPSGATSMEFAARLINEAGIVVTPGVGFGDQGEGFFRFALSVSNERIKEAVERLGKLSL